ncbi:hypothetical protein Tco_1464705 [Tanacetum coccineum]
MYAYLKHVGNKKHSDLKSQTFEEIQALYEKVKRFDESFTVVGSTEDERRIKEMSEGVKDTDQKRSKKKTQQRKKPKKQSDVDSDDEHRKCLKIVTFEGTIDSEIMEKKLFIARLNNVSSQDGDYLVIYRANGNFKAFNYLMEYSENYIEGIEMIHWGDLKIMMESSTEENDQSDFWSNQQDWKIITWRLYEACRVCILEFKDGTVIHMLVERRARRRETTASKAIGREEGKREPKRRSRRRKRAEKQVRKDKCHNKTFTYEKLNGRRKKKKKREKRVEDRERGEEEIRERLGHNMLTTIMHRNETSKREKEIA